MTGFTLPASSSGQTLRRSEAAIAPFLFDAARPQPRAGQGQPLAHDRPEIDLGDDAALGRDADVPALHREDAQIPLDVIAADHVEHDIDAAIGGRLLDDRDEILVLVVDAARRAQFLAGVTFVAAAGGGEDRAAR